MRKNSMDSLSCPAGTGMWRIKMKIKKPSHIIKGGGFRVSKLCFIYALRSRFRPISMAASADFLFCW